MNWQYSTSFYVSNNKFMSTAYSPKPDGEQIVNKLFQPIVSSKFRVPQKGYSLPAFLPNPGGEQV
jgi:hypothetical protein